MSFSCSLRPLLPALLLATASFAARAQGVGIGTPTPDASAALEVKTTTQGLLPPRLTAAQRAAIANPAQGLQVYQTDGTPGLYYYSGVVWVNLNNGRQPDAAGSTVPANGGMVNTLASVSTYPAGVALDANGTLYVAEQSGSLIQKITAAGAVSTLAGSGATGSTNGTGTAATFNNPVGIAVDANGVVYVADQNNNLIRQITPAGVVSTFAGSGTASSLDGTGTAATFNSPTGLAIDAAGTLYVTELNGQVIRKITPAGVVSTLAGLAATTGNTNGTGAAARFNQPTGVAVDATGTLYVADRTNQRIRKITPAGVVTTLAGSGASGSLNGTGTSATFNQPFGVGVDGGGTVYVADRGNNLVRRITATGVVTTLAGSGTAGSTNGTGTSASFDLPFCVVIDAAGLIYVSDYNNRLVRLIR